ncbi:hypothetical protein D3C72_2386100 [compost metagenome]
MGDGRCPIAQAVDHRETNLAGRNRQVRKIDEASENLFVVARAVEMRVDAEFASQMLERLTLCAVTDQQHIDRTPLVLQLCRRVEQ